MHPPTNHLPHVLMLLHSLKSAREETGNATMPKEVFLAREKPSHLLELVGLRLRGLDALVLACIRFRKQTVGEGQLSRQSLASFLSNPEREVGLVDTQPPKHLIEVTLPDTREPVLKFLERCREGVDYPTMIIDRGEVELAFDFRLDNPSRMRKGDGSGEPRERHLFRTTGGHLLSAVPHRLPNKLMRDDPFLALTRPVQHTPTRDRPLPTLVVHRRFLTLTTPMRGKLTSWLNFTLPLHVDLANPDHLLDHRLDSYRAYRNRMLEEEEAATRTA